MQQGQKEYLGIFYFGEFLPGKLENIGCDG